MEAVILITREKDGLKIAGVLKDNYQLKEADFCFKNKIETIIVFIKIENRR